MTTLLAVLPEENQLIFACCGSSATNRNLLKSERNVLVGQLGGIHVQFSVGPVSELIYGGSKAFSVALPKYIVRLQFNKLSGNDKNRIQRYIGKLERERRGLA